MDDIKEINITISSWPGTGATTLSLILANLLKRKYLNMGNVFRYLGLKLGFSNEGVDRPEFDNYIENIINDYGNIASLDYARDEQLSINVYVHWRLSVI
jgi:cytidylate kinase